MALFIRRLVSGLFRLSANTLGFLTSAIVSPLTGFTSASQALSLIPGSFGCTLRYTFYKRSLKHLGRPVLFSFGVILTDPDISIGDNVRFGPYNTIAKVNIGNDVLTAQHVHFLSGSTQHHFERLDVPIISQVGALETIQIHGDNWIGTGSIIMADIGKGAIVGAGSVVTRPIPDYAICAGSPAKTIKSRK